MKKPIFESQAISKEFVKEEQMQSLNETRARAIILELTKLSVKHFLIAPGSRNTPLILAAAENSLAVTTVHFDERGLAFHALGIAKATKKPVCLICTSGTALANFYPAIVEASVDFIPLIILAGDRPIEHRDVGYNQTIDQVKIFGHYLRWEFDLPCSDPSLPDEVIESVVDQAHYRATSSPIGPVLINVMFREPLTCNQKLPSLENKLFPLPKTQYYSYDKTISSEAMSHIAAELSSYEKGVIIAAKMPREENYESLLILAMRLQWPIFADSLSGLRRVGRDTCLIPYYNHILKTSYSKEAMTPDIVLHFGGQFVSKPLLQWIDALELKKYYQIADFPNRRDPSSQVTDRIEMSPISFCEKATMYIKHAPSSLWLGLWKEHSLHVEETIHEFFDKHNSLSEPKSVQSILPLVDEDLQLFFGTSLPIRYADNFFFPKEKSGMLYSNRGASGIDGNLATVLGIAKGSGKQVFAVIGDLTFLHDVNSLALLKDPSIQVTILLLNNNGGGIFNFLPIKSRQEHFNEFVRHKHDIPLRPFIEAFDAKYICPTTTSDYETALNESLKTPGVTIIEIKTDPEENFALHENLEALIRKKHLQSKKEKELCYFTLTKKT